MASMTVSAWAGFLCVMGAPLAAQDEASVNDSTRVLLLEYRFGPDSAGNAVVALERGVVYRADLTGPGTPVFQPLRRSPRSAFVVPIEEGRTDEPRHFEVYAIQAGPHMVPLSVRQGP